MLLACVVTNAESGTPSLVAAGVAATDIALLLIMLVGLFRMRRDGGGMFGLAQVLWRQVLYRFSLPSFSGFIDMFSFCKGVIWLLLATVVEIPPLVSLTTTLSPVSYSFIVLGVQYFGLEL